MADVSTVLGPVPVTDLGVVAIHESLLSVLPGAQYAFDIALDQAQIFSALAPRLTAFRAAGGGTVVDATGMFHGRDLPLLESLSRATGVHIVASTGLGPEELLGGYFLTPQTNPPTPWPAEKFADLFTREITEGMVVPRLERRAPAGIVVTAADQGGMTATEESLFRGAARTAKATGVPAYLQFGADPMHDLGIALDEGLAADRIVMGGMDRAAAGHAALAIAERGAFVGIDHVGSTDTNHLDDASRVSLVLSLIEAGRLDRILLSSSAVGVAKGHPGNDLPYTDVLTRFAPLLRAEGVSDESIRRILVTNPANLLARR